MLLLLQALSAYAAVTENDRSASGAGHNDTAAARALRESGNFTGRHVGDHRRMCPRPPLLLRPFPRLLISLVAVLALLLACCLSVRLVEIRCGEYHYQLLRTEVPESSDPTAKQPGFVYFPVWCNAGYTRTVATEETTRRELCCCSCQNYEPVSPVAPSGLAESPTKTSTSEHGNQRFTHLVNCSVVA